MRGDRRRLHYGPSRQRPVLERSILAAASNS